MKIPIVCRGTGRLLILVALMTVSGCGNAPQETPPAAPADASQAPAREAPPPWHEEYEEMVQVLALPSTQQQALRAAFETSYGEFEEALSGEQGAKLVAEEQALRRAAEARDLAAVRRITGQKKTQRQAAREMVQSGKEQVLAVLQPEQRLQWDAHRISRELIALAGPGLSPEQQAAIRNQAPTVLYAASQRREPNPMAAGFLALEQWAENNVFTGPQRQAYQDMKKRHPVRSLKW